MTPSHVTMRATVAPVTRPLDLERSRHELRESFETDFSLWDGKTGHLIRPGNGVPPGDPETCAALVRVLAESETSQFVREENHVALLAVPLPDGIVAVAPFVIREVEGDQGFDPGDLDLLGLDALAALSWAGEQEVWSPRVLLRLARAVTEKLSAIQRIEELSEEVEQIAGNLSSTYEEISLLYRMTRHLTLNHGDEALGRMALDWLLECIPAEGLILQWLPVTEAGEATYQARTDSRFATCGVVPLDHHEFNQLRSSLVADELDRPLVVNHPVTESDSWSFPAVRQVILVELREGDHSYGYLAALNHRQQLEFGTVEATLLSSVAALLGMHSANCELYRQQGDFLASVVRALTSAIDAKDPYTCGHSDRVARMAVRLAEDLGVDREQLDTIYMSGLLHDIGKIGIDDNVLRKPGRLNDAEFEHIKLHPTLGHRILADIRQLADVLPAVLSHHEHWDGRGYPHGLQGADIPYVARIVAVADAFDAMTSDRPYRQGMDYEKVDAIFRAGAGTQWDPDIVEAYWRTRDELRRIAHRQGAAPELPDWS